MIRRFEYKDLDQIMSMWLHTNMEAHSFIRVLSRCIIIIGDICAHITEIQMSVMKNKKTWKNL